MSSKRAGFTLVEVMIAMVVLGFVMGAAISVFRSQSTNFRVGGQRLELEQNLRYAVGTLDRVIRTAGAGTIASQPMFVYGDTVTIAVNADYTDSVTPTNAVYYNPDAPPGSFTALPVGFAYILPNTTFTYPSMTYLDPVNGTPGAAETIVIYFRSDSSTADPNDFVMMMRVNALPAELIARNVYKIPNTPFLRYYVHRTTLAVPPATRDSNIVCPSASCVGSIRHTVALHNSAADTNGTLSALADSVKAVQINLRVTNGLTGADQRFRDVSSISRLPNNGLIQLRTCGAVPILAGPLTALGSPSTGTWPQPGDTLRWAPSADETGGERDIQNYNIYRRIPPATNWDIVSSMPANQPSYTYFDGNVVVGTTYDYAVGASDCTPNESSLIVATSVTPF